MIIVAGGDSFVFGAELADQVKGTPSKSTYPALLATSIGAEYLCAAASGNSNSAITRMTMNACESKKGADLFVLVSWTFSCRYEFHFNYQVRRGTRWYSVNPWDASNIENVTPMVEKNPDILKHHQDHFSRLESLQLGDFATQFFKHIGDNELYETYTTLKEIVFLQNYLEINKIPYLFTCQDTEIFYHFEETHNDPNVKALLSQVNMDKWYLFPRGHGVNQVETPRGFYQWAMENKYPVGTTHPLEQAHQAAANIMQEKFNEMVKKSL